ncbi:MAG: hypothetical protein ACRDYV_07470, partial [Acidimicrobiia bacterium]
EEARAALGRGAIDVLAVPLSLADVEPGRALAETGAARDVAVVADDPLGADGEAWAGRLLAGLVHPDAERSPAQAMLAGVLSLPGLVSVLSPGTSPSEIGEHAGVAALPLSDAEARTLAARLDEARESQLDP